MYHRNIYIYKVGICPICFSPCLRCGYSYDEIDPIIALKHRRGRQLVETSSIDNNIVTTTLAKEGIKPTRSVRVATVAALKLIGKVAMSEDILEKVEKVEKKKIQTIMCCNQNLQIASLQKTQTLIKMKVVLLQMMMSQSLVPMPLMMLVL